MHLCEKSFGQGSCKKINITYCHIHFLFLKNFSVNECAFICYQNACSYALFEKSDSLEQPSRCHLDLGPNTETCASNLQRHYAYPNINGTLLSCVRCGTFGLCKNNGPLIFDLCSAFDRQRGSVEYFSWRTPFLKVKIKNSQFKGGWFIKGQFRGF